LVSTEARLCYGNTQTASHQADGGQEGKAVPHLSLLSRAELSEPFENVSNLVPSMCLMARPLLPKALYCIQASNKLSGIHDVKKLTCIIYIDLIFGYQGT